MFLLVSCSANHESDPVIRPQTDFFESVKSNDVPLGKPKEGEWLYEHKEPGQTFEEYKIANPLRLNDTQHIIYLKPYGEFSKDEKMVLEYTANYLEIFFQIKTRLLEISDDKLIPDTSRRISSNGTEQLLASYFIDHLLRKEMPKDGIVLMAITSKDLYPKKDWSFVFGLASYQDRIGVCSINRLFMAAIDSFNYGSCLMRLIKIASHEIGHMFTLHHCTNAYCTMNGSNSLLETDIQPNRLCSECLKKLFWNLQFDNKQRLKSLMGFFYLHKMKKDYNLTKIDFEATE